jgi:hypothetical protein
MNYMLAGGWLLIIIGIALFYGRFMLRAADDLGDQYLEGYLGCALGALGFVLSLKATSGASADFTVVDWSIVGFIVVVAAWAIALRFVFWRNDHR